MKKNYKKKQSNQQGIFTSKKTATEIPYRNELEKNFCLTNEFNPKIIDYYRLEWDMGEFHLDKGFNQLSVFVVVYSNFHCELILLDHSNDIEELIYLFISSRVKRFTQKLRFNFSILNDQEIEDSTLVETRELIYNSAGTTVSDYSISTIERIFEENDSVSLETLNNFISKEEIYTLILKGFIHAELDGNLINKHTRLFKEDALEDLSDETDDLWSEDDLTEETNDFQDGNYERPENSPEMF